MASLPQHSISELIIRSGLALDMSQEELGRLLGVSRKTISRWTHSLGALDRGTLTTLARALLPVDPDLAQRLAVAHEETIESLGIGPLPAPRPDPAALAALPYLIDSIVCAAAEALDTSPRAVRPALLVAVQRARQAGLSLEAWEAALRPPAPAEPIPIPRAGRDTKKPGKG